MESNKEIRKLLEVAVYAGKLMLINGGETYRVEETIEWIVKSRGVTDIENFIVPTGIFVSCEHEGEQYSYLRRIRSTRIDLEIISLVNAFSREFVQSDMTTDVAMDRLREIEHAPLYKWPVTVVFGGLAGAFFALMLGGQWPEGVLAFVTSGAVVAAVRLFQKHIASYFIRSTLGGAVTMTVAYLLTAMVSPWLVHVRLDQVVIGSIMPLVPGVAITNALRDSINGDFVTGVSKMTEAIITALGIAIGVGVILQAINSLGGGV